MAWARRLLVACSLLSFGIGGASASPPLGCVENSKGQRWCQSSKAHFKRTPPETDALQLGWVHPAFKVNRQLPEPVGRQVAVLPVELFLPQYFEYRAYPFPPKKEAVVVPPPAVVPDAKP